MGCLGALMLLPFAGLSWLAVKIVDLCAKKGGGMRLMGVIASFILGGICIRLGYWGAFEGYTEWRGTELYKVTYPVWGWIGIVIGGIIIIFLSLTALTKTKQQIELEEREEQEKKEAKEEAWRGVKKMAADILEKDKIDDLATFNRIVQILEKEPLDSEASKLVSQLKKLKKKQE